MQLFVSLQAYVSFFSVKAISLNFIIHKKCVNASYSLPFKFLKSFSQ